MSENLLYKIPLGIRINVHFQMKPRYSVSPKDLTRNQSERVETRYLQRNCNLMKLDGYFRIELEPERFTVLLISRKKYGT